MSRDKHCALRLMLVLVFAAISLPVGAQDALPVPPTATAVRQHKAFVDGVNEMSVKMYRATAKDPHQTGDAVLSPLSVTILASMLSAGTSDVVEQRACQQIAPGLSASELHAKIKGYFASVRERRGINGDLAIANSLWSDSSLELRKPYADFARGQYGAELHAADFRGAPDTALAQINQWVKHQTKGAIPHLLKRSQISERTKLIGVNAVYFSRNWMIPFDEQLTKSEDFFAPTGAVKTSMMALNQTTPYFKDADAEVLTLSFRDGSDAIFILPSEKSTLNELTEKLTWRRIAGWMEQSKLHVVSGKIPHIRIESEYQLVPTLSKVGLGDLTSTEFTRIFSGRDPIAIDNVIQKAVVDVNEKGAMAAAATAAIMSIPISPIVIENPAATFDLNRPFLFLLRDAETNMILFMGRMVSPK